MSDRPTGEQVATPNLRVPKNSEIYKQQSKMMALIETTQLRIQNSRRYSQIKGVSHVLLE